MRLLLPVIAAALLLSATPALAKIKTGTCPGTSRACTWAELQRPKGWSQSLLMGGGGTEVRLIPAKADGKTYISSQVEVDTSEFASLDAYVQREINNFTKFYKYATVAKEPIVAADGQAMQVVFFNPTVDAPYWFAVAYGRDTTANGKPYFVIITLSAGSEALRSALLPDFQQVVSRYGK